ncbi:hypothetical protein C0992_009509 [Termitomyces sp. T32_za158]|nr:hypothetical protein C0992_009509 [Termitomyces sp. T32_za158]
MSALRVTRSGAPFSPWAAPVYCRSGFDFPGLLQETHRLESEDLFDCPIDASTGLDAASLWDAGPDQTDALAPPTKASAVPRRPTPPLTAAKSSLDAPSTRRQHMRRAARRRRNAEKEGHAPSLRTKRLYLEAAQPLHSAVISETLPAARGGYQAVQGALRPGDQTAWSLERLVEEEGLSLVQWNGIDPRPLVDNQGRIIAVLAGRPQAECYQQSAARLYESLLHESQSAPFSRDEVVHRRGRFPALNAGVYYGTGTRKVVNLDAGVHADLLQRLLKNPDLERLANFASALNFPPNAWTYRHRDSGNCPFGFCAIQALGHFDPTRGGHLILWEAGCIVEFPPGALVLLPSAMITHSNVPVQKGDSRASFTQYAPGGLFRYVDNGYRTEGELKQQDPEGYQRMLDMKEGRWVMGLGLFSKLNDVVKPHTASVLP